MSRIMEGEIPGLRSRWRIRTETGSIYHVSLSEDGRWWLGADNVPNPTSRSLADGCWEIQRPAPWPPVPGRSLRLLAPADLSLGDPARVPGGGKITSRVVDVEPETIEFG